MKRNKEIKVGDKIWLNSAYLDILEFHTVKSVKKQKTLVTVVVDATDYKDSYYEIIMYGHASSCLLSGYDRKRQFNYAMVYTCDYSTVTKKTDTAERNAKYREAGMALLNIAKFFK